MFSLIVQFIFLSLTFSSTGAQSSQALLSSKSSQQNEAVPSLSSWCQELRDSIQKFGWKLEPCAMLPWKIGGRSAQGRPLVYLEFGDPQSNNTTLLLATVHGDEITPLYLGIELARWLQSRERQIQGSRVVVAPLVNPDGFLMSPRRSRMNFNGVDLNRNFPTDDWAYGKKRWETKYRRNKRRNPGHAPGSEKETQFQIDLIEEFKPQKILSIHSPLNFLDYDGPSSVRLSQFPKQYAKECERLKIRLKAISNGFFPGSLGNYAGQKLGIPTLTLELPSADWKQAKNYWIKFSQGIETMIQYHVPSVANVNAKQQTNKPQLDG